MFFILEPIINGLFQWLYGLILDFVSYCANGLLGVMNSDLTFFETHVPAIGTMVDVFIAVGWALLIGNLVFQAMKSMLSGFGFEGEAPGILLIRTGIFGFLLLASRQVCEIGLDITGSVMALLEIPSHIDITSLDEGMFTGVGSAGWLLVIIFGIIMIFQIFKLLFEIGERYVVMCVMTFLSPLAFAMGGSKSTHDIFKGWVRMFASMMLLMILNIVFLKMILSAMSTVPTGALLLPWLVLIVALAKVGRKIDSHIARIGLNPAVTGDRLGSGFPGLVAYSVARNMISSVTHRSAPAPATSSGANASGGSGSFGFAGASGGSNTPSPTGCSNNSSMAQTMASNTVRTNTVGGSSVSSSQSSHIGGDVSHSTVSHMQAGSEQNLMIAGGSQTADSSVSREGTVRRAGNTKQTAGTKAQGANQPGSTITPAFATSNIGGAVDSDGKSATSLGGKGSSHMKNQAGITVIPTDKMTPVSGAGQSRGRGDIAGRPVTNMQTLSDSDPKAGGAKLVPSNQSAAHETAVQHNQIDGKKQNIHANNAGATVSGIVNNKKDVHQNGTTTITPSKGARGDVPVVSPPPAMAGSAGPGRANTPPSGAQKGASGQIINSGDMGKGTSHQGGKNTVPAPGVQGGAIVPQNQNRQHHAVNSIRQDGPPLVNRPAGNTGLTGNAPSSGKNMGNNHGQQSGSRQNRPQSGQYPRGGSAPTPSEPGGQQGRSGASPVKSANNNRNIRPVDPNKGKKNGGGKS